MTDHLMQKLEEKVTLLVNELDSMRKELHHLRQESSSLKAEKNLHTKKLQSLISLLDSLDAKSSLNHELELIQGNADPAEACA